MISVKEALERILTSLKAVETETIPLDEALGRVLAKDIISKRTHPPSDVSAMDGYAIRAEDAMSPPTSLRVIGESAAGKPFNGVVQTGEAVRIFTGAHLPSGTDSIMMQENTDRLSDEIVRLNTPAILARHVRPKGLDVQQGDICLNAGTYLSSRHIGLAATAGYGHVTTYKRPKIGLLFTGSELVKPGDPCGPDQIVNSNAPMLSALIEQYGGAPVNLGIAEDSAEAILEAAKGFQDVDLCVTVGGASVGDHDLVQPVLKQAGLEVDFWKIAMKPGKPLIYGSFQGKPFIGLPGNPVSALVCAFLYLVPALKALTNQSDCSHIQLKARVESILSENGPRQDYIRAVFSQTPDGLKVTPLSIQDSSMLSSLAQSNCLLVREPHAPAAEIGEQVAILPFDLG